MTEPDQLDGAIRAALDHPGPALVEVMTDALLVYAGRNLGVASGLHTAWNTPSTRPSSPRARAASLNGTLARTIAERLTDRGERVDLIDLSRFDMPMYHGDLEADEGVPPAATELAERLASARRLVITSPEYNGAYPALLKNTIDWLTRVDRGVLAHLDIHLAAVSPGRMGGTRGLAHLRAWLEMHAPLGGGARPQRAARDARRRRTDHRRGGIDIDGFLSVN